jgi:hypothetical protein
MIIIKGQVPSKSNGYRIGNNRLYKSLPLKEYEVSFEWQIRKHKGQVITEPYIPNAAERCEDDCCEPDTRPFPENEKKTVDTAATVNIKPKK